MRIGQSKKRIETDWTVKSTLSKSDSINPTCLFSLRPENFSRWG